MSCGGAPGACTAREGGWWSGGRSDWGARRSIVESLAALVKSGVVSTVLVHRGVRSSVSVIILASTVGIILPKENIKDVALSRIEVVCRRGHIQTVVKVRDDGPGMMIDLHCIPGGDGVEDRATVRSHVSFLRDKFPNPCHLRLSTQSTLMNRMRVPYIHGLDCSGLTSTTWRSFQIPLFMSPSHDWIGSR